jgi:hypothetical protein
MLDENVKVLTVSRVYNLVKGRDVPMIRLKGAWLEQLGFKALDKYG